MPEDPLSDPGLIQVLGRFIDDAQSRLNAAQSIPETDPILAELDAAADRERQRNTLQRRKRRAEVAALEACARASAYPDNIRLQQRAMFFQRAAEEETRLLYAFLSGQPAARMHYVYALAYPSGRVFYIGKGQGRRMYAHESEAQRGYMHPKCVAIREIWAAGGQVVYNILLETEDERLAYQTEAKLISACRGHLTNRTHKPMPERVRHQLDLREKTRNIRHLLTRRRFIPEGEDEEDEQTRRDIEAYKRLNSETGLS